MARKEQGLKAVKMNATEDVDWLDTPSVVDAAVERLRLVKATGLDVGLDFHGRLHKPMAKQLARALEPHRPLFIEEPVLVEHLEALKQLAGMTSIPIALGQSDAHCFRSRFQHYINLCKSCRRAFVSQMGCEAVPRRRTD